VNTIAIILAAGSGERFRGSLPKQFQKLAGRTLLEICLERFQAHPGIDGIVLVCPAAQLAQAAKTVSTGHFAKVVKVIAGGKTRQESSFAGVTAIPAGVKNVLIHDAARALVPAGIITRVLAALKSEQAVIAVLPAADTIVRVDAAAMVTAVLDRAKLSIVQTPQGFRLEVIRQAHEQAKADGFGNASDDGSLVLRYKLAPLVTVLGDPGNIKITYPQDLAMAEAILRNT